MEDAVVDELIRPLDKHYVQSVYSSNKVAYEKSEAVI